MSFLLCCLRGGAEATTAGSNPSSATVFEQPTSAVRALDTPKAYITSPSQAPDAVTRLKALLLSAPLDPSVRLSHGVREVQECLGSALVSILGAAPLPSSRGRGLTVLQSCGAGAGALCQGEVLFLPTHVEAQMHLGGYTPLQPWGALPGACSGVKRKQSSGGTVEPVYLPEWSRWLMPLAETCPPGEGHVVLLPLLLAGRLVGGMVLALPVGDRPAAGLGAAEPRAASAGGKDPRGGTLDAEQRAVREWLLSEPGGLQVLAACVAECCLGPVLAPVEQVCAAAEAALLAPTLQDLASALAYTISSTLAAELHVDLAVRLALAPSREAATGVLFEGALGRASGAPLRGPSWQRSLTQALATRLTSGNSGTGGAGMYGSGGLGAGGLPRSTSMQSGVVSSPGPRGGAPTLAGLVGRVPSATSGQSRMAMMQAVAARAAMVANQPSSSLGVTLHAPTSADDVQVQVAASDSSYTEAHAGGAPNGLGRLRGKPLKATPLDLSSALLANLLSPVAANASGGAAGAKAGTAGTSGAPGNTSVSPGIGLSANLRSGTFTHITNAAVGSAGAGSSYNGGASSSSVQLQAAVVPSVPQYLQDAELPTSDVFTLVRRAQPGSSLASLIVIGAVEPQPSPNLPANLAAAATGASGTTGGASYPSGTASVSRHHEAIHSSTGHPAVKIAAFDPATGAAVTAPAGGGAYESAPPGLSARRAVMAAAGGGSHRSCMGMQTLQAPVVGVYLCSYAQLPVSLLHAARDRAMSMLEVLLPPALRALSRPPVQEEWAYLAAQASGLIPMDDTRRLSSGTGYTLPSGAGVGLTNSSTMGARGVRRTQEATGPGGALSPRRGASALPPATAGSSLGAGVTPPMSRVGVAAAAAAALPSGGSLVPRGEARASLGNSTDADMCGAGGSSVLGQGANGGGNGAPVDLLLSTSLENQAELFGMPDQDLDGAAALMTTVLSDGPEAGPTGRHQQLDIMVSTFHDTLARVRQDATSQAGVHAEEDIRALRLVKAIGQGACSVVLLARLHGMPVAVKVILPPEEEEAAHAAANGTGAAAASAAKPPVTEKARQTQMRILMRGARELAVMTSVSHPNIVQVYSYCTRVVVQQSANGLPYLEPIPEGAPIPAALSCVLIMEWCDLGSLADAIDNGAFARYAKAAAAALAASSSQTRGSQSAAVNRIDRNALQNSAAASGAVTGGGGSAGFSHLLLKGAPVAGNPQTCGTPALRAVYLTLLEVALALRHLHAMNLVHCDVKPANVLLRSSATDPRGFTAKLADFGFVNVLEAVQELHAEQDAAAERTSSLDVGSPRAPVSTDSGPGGKGGPHRLVMRTLEPVGTVTHMAPELFIKGSTVDHSIDVYAFGVLMWEMYTSRAPYAEYADNNFKVVPVKVVREGLRPRFPAETPLQYKLLAQACWSSQPSRRPTASVLVSRLQQLLDTSCAQPGGEH